MNALTCLLKPRALSCATLEKAYGKFIREFYMRPGITFSNLSLLLKSPENCRRLAAGISSRLFRRWDSLTGFVCGGRGEGWRLGQHSSKLLSLHDFLLQKELG